MSTEPTASDAERATQHAWNLVVSGAVFGNVQLTGAECKALLADRAAQVKRVEELGRKAREYCEAMMAADKAFHVANACIEALTRDAAQVEEDDLLVFLDDSFSGGNEIRFVPTSEPVGARTEERDGATIVWVDEPPSINDEGDTERPHETLSDALRDWYKRDARPARAALSAPAEEANSQPTTSNSQVSSSAEEPST